jgi:cysteinyl-tRNA synthetase
MYTCGPTVCRFAHIGDLRSYLLSDLIRRNAERHRLSVEVAQNITDVGPLGDDGEAGATGETEPTGENEPTGDEKAAAQTRAEGQASPETARFYEDAFRADCAALNLRPPEHSPRASPSA